MALSPLGRHHVQANTAALLVAVGLGHLAFAIIFNDDGRA